MIAPFLIVKKIIRYGLWSIDYGLSLLHSHRLRQIPWLINITLAHYRNVVG
jgi:hypothetical protein